MKKTAELKKLRDDVRIMSSDTGVSDPEFVSWLTKYAERAQFLTNGVHEHTISGLEADIRKEYTRFGTGVAGQRVVDFAEKHKLTLPHNEDWWFIRERQAEYDKNTLKERSEERQSQAKEKGSKKKQPSLPLLQNLPLTGSLEGIPNSWGIPRITNGIDVYIERPDGSLFKGHRDVLKWDRKAKDPENVDENGQPKAKLKVKKEEPKFSESDLRVAQQVLNNGAMNFELKYFEVTGKTLFIPELKTAEALAPFVKEYFEAVMSKITL